MKQELLFVEDLKKIKPFWNNLNDFTHTCIDVGQFIRGKRYNKACIKKMESEARFINKNDSSSNSIDEYYIKEDFNFYHNSKKVTPLTKEKEFVVNAQIELNETLYIKSLDIMDDEEEYDYTMPEFITYNIIDDTIKKFYIINSGNLLYIELENDFKYYLDKISNSIEEKKRNSDEILFKDEFIFVTVKITKISFYCPECNTRMFCKQNTCKDVARVLTSATIFDNEDKISLSLSFLEKNVRFKAVWMKSYRKKIVFNKKTLITYMIGNLGVKGNKALLNKEKSSIVINRIKKHDKFFLLNEIGDSKSKDKYLKSVVSFLTYRDNYLKELLGKEYKYASKDIKNMEENFYIEEGEKNIVSWYANNLEEREKIVRYNTIYNHLIAKKTYKFNNFYMESLIEAIKIIRPSLMKQIKGKSEKEILKFFKIRKKDLKYFIGWNKNYTDHIVGNSFAKDKIDELYLKVFDLIDDINYCQRLFKSLIINDIEKRYFIDKMNNIPRRLLKTIRRNMSERRFVRFIEKSANEHNWYWQDAYRDYTRLGKFKNKIDFKKIDNIVQLHDLCSNLYRKLRNENKTIPKEEALKAIFDKNYIFNNEITYSLAKNTHELINVGAFMNICVGGYDYRVMNKESFIVIGYDNEHNPVTCIEINQVEEGLYLQYKVNQVKKKYNQCASHEEQKFLIEEVFVKNNIIATENFDLRDYYTVIDV